MLADSTRAAAADPVVLAAEATFSVTTVVRRWRRVGSGEPTSSVVRVVSAAGALVEARFESGRGGSAVGAGGGSGDSEGTAGSSTAGATGSSVGAGSAGVVFVSTASGALTLDEAESPSDTFELVRAPPELCTMPERGSAADVEPDSGDPSDDEPDAASGEEPDTDDESDADELESEGSASAIPGVLAMAAPTPSATANAPTRPMYCA